MKISALKPGCAGRHMLAGVLAALLAWAYPAVSVQAQSLQEALGQAYRYNPRLDAARATLRATDEEVSRANAGYRPSFTGTGDFGVQNSETRPASTTTNGETHPRGFALNATQPIFRGFRVINTVREAEALVRAGRETLRTAEQGVLLDAVTAYMDVLRDQAIVKIRENNVNVLSRELKATQDRFKVGEVTRTDVSQAEARRAAAVSALDVARASLKTSLGSFERHIGRQPSGLIEPRPVDRLLPKALGEAISVSAKEAPAVVAALYREQAARHTVDKIWGELLPTAQLEANYQRRYDPSPVTERSETTTVRGTVTVPFYTGGEVQARVRQAKQTHLARLQEIEQSRSEVQAQVVAAWSQLAAARGRLVSDNAQVKAARTALAGVREEEKVGQRTLLDVLNAEQEALNAEVALATSKRDLVVASYTVLSAIGRLNISELGAADRVYDPEVHYKEVRREWWKVNITHGDGRTEHHDFWDARVEKHPGAPDKATRKP